MGTGLKCGDILPDGTLSAEEGAVEVVDTLRICDDPAWNLRSGVVLIVLLARGDGEFGPLATKVALVISVGFSFWKRPAPTAGELDPERLEGSVLLRARPPDLPEVE